MPVRFGIDIRGTFWFMELWKNSRGASCYRSFCIEELPVGTQDVVGRFG